jgi:hypothetical protein
MSAVRHHSLITFWVLTYAISWESVAFEGFLTPRSPPPESKRPHILRVLLPTHWQSQRS